MTASWNDIENAIKNSTIESLDKAKLEEFSKVAPPNFQNPGLIANYQNAQQRILRRLAQIESNEQEQREEAKFATSIRWSKIAAISAILGTIFAFSQIVIYFLEHNKRKTDTSPKIQQTTQSTQQPTRSQEGMPSSLSTTTRIPPSEKSK